MNFAGPSCSTWLDGALFFLGFHRTSAQALGQRIPKVCVELGGLMWLYPNYFTVARKDILDDFGASWYPPFSTTSIHAGTRAGSLTALLLVSSGRRAKLECSVPWLKGFKAPLSSRECQNSRHRPIMTYFSFYLSI